MMKFWRNIFLALFMLLPRQGEAAVPDILNSAAYQKILGYLLINQDDVQLYKKIFRAIDEADFAKADELSAELDNHILLGTVLAQKYLHPKYRSTAPELAQWLVHYADLPAAGRISRLARRKGVAAELLPPLPEGADFLAGRQMSAQTKAYLYKEVGRFRKFLRQGKTKRARQVLEQTKLRQLLPDAVWDDLAASLALKYFVDGYNQLAWQWGVRASRRRTSGVAPWVAGLAAWRKKDYKNAALYFERLARSGNNDEWLTAAGGYWAWRADMRLLHPNKAREMLAEAARYKQTFYGILAAYQLGQTINYNWETISYLNDFDNLDYIHELVASPSIRRAVLLLHAKQPKLAEEELRHGYDAMTPQQKEAVLFLAARYDLHALAIFAGNDCRDNAANRSYEELTYPVPQWWPQRNWQIDKALVLAMVRQESAFRPEAESAAGACGLMQLMPRTAYQITNDRALRNNKKKLKDASFNLELGQRYVSYLLDKPYIDGNLFYMLTAYNGGPGNMLKWKKQAHAGQDALLFIEAIPSAETRIYIERVMANYWIYAMRFGLPTPTLAQVAADEWPLLPH